MKKKILFGITSLSLGGAERVLIDLVNCLKQEYDITIFTLYGKGELEKQLSKEICLINLYKNSYDEISKFKKLWISFNLIFFGRQIYNKKIKKDYNIEISFLEGPITRLFNYPNKNTKKIAWVHNDIFLVFGEGIKAKLKRYIDKRVYKQYEKIIFVSKDNCKKFQQTYPKLCSKKLEVIYNYIDKENIIQKAEEVVKEVFNKKYINIVTVARLVEQKAIDRLISVHKRLIKEDLVHNVYVIGDGPLKSNLEQQIKTKQIQNTFHLLGKRENPYPYIKNADYFCLLSYFEGYGMVLEEAKILKKPICITDTAAREGIQDYENAIVFDNNENAIYEGLKNIIQKGKKQNIQKDIKDYDNKNIIKQVINLLNE